MNRRTVRILLVAYLLCVGYLCFASFKAIPSAPIFILGIQADRIVHFLMFVPFPFLAFFSFEDRNKTFWQVLLILILIFSAGCLVAGATEYIQGLLPHRVKDIEDFKADTLGLILGSLITLLAIIRIQGKRL